MNHEVQHIETAENMSIAGASRQLLDQQTTAKSPGSHKPAIIDRQPTVARPCSNRLSTATNGQKITDNTFANNDLGQTCRR